MESYNCNHILFRQDEEADKFYIVLSGLIGIYMRGEHIAETSKSGSENLKEEGENNKDKSNNSDNASGNIFRKGEGIG